jgi:hypothetical protein
MASIGKYHPVVRNMMDALQSTNPTIPDEAASIIVNYKLVSMVSNMRAKIDYVAGRGLAPINFYGVLLMDSGVGKTSSLTTLDHWYFSDVKDKLYKLYNMKRKQLEDLIDRTHEDEEEARKLKNQIATWVFSFSSGTKEGMLNLAQTLGKLEALTLSVEIDELDKYFSTEVDIINSLFKAYDIGEWNPKLIKSERATESIKGVAPNFFGFATPNAMLLNTDLADKFRDVLASGFARRTFFYHEDDDKLPYIPSADDYLKIEEKSAKMKAESVDLSKMLSGLLNPSNLNKVIKFSTKSKRHILEYKSLSVEKASYTSDPIMNAEYRERDFKVAKLAGAYAFVDGRDEITVQDIDYAISMSEHSSHSLERISESKSMIERLYLRVRAEEGFVHTQDMLNFGLISKTNTSKIKEYAEELEPYADVYGDIFEVMRDGKGLISAVRIIQLISTNDDECIISASMPKRDGSFNHENGYKKAEIPFRAVADWMIKDGVCYAPVGFRGGKRNNESTEAYSNLIILDVDDGMSLDYAKEIFKDYYAIITTTRNHQKEKHGVVGDRFRVALLSSKYIYTDPNKYKKLMENIQTFYGFTVDKACFDKAHIYYGNPSEVWFGSCEKKFDVAKLIPSDDDHLSKKINKHIQPFRPEGGKALIRYFENSVAKACMSGTEIINALRDAMFATTDVLRAEFKTVDEVEEWLTDISSSAPDVYWSKHDIEKEIFTTLRNKWE